MKILYIATSFPKVEKGSTIYTDLAEALVENNHDVTIIVSEERKNTKKNEWLNERGCKILRVKTGNIYDVNILEKGLSVLTLGFFLKRAINKYLSECKFDLILYEAPPVTNCTIVNYAKKKFNAKSYLMLKDIFPQNAVDLRIIKKNSIIYKLFKSKEKQLYSVSDFIGCMSKANQDYILKHNNLNKEKVGIFPNTKKISKIRKRTNIIRDKYNISNDKKIVLFGGNLGKPQGVDSLCKVIQKLKDFDQILFMIVGRGTEKNKLNKFIQENKLTNVLQLENLPRNEYEEIVRETDIGLVLLNNKFTIPNYPSRILSYMEYSIPVIAATDKNTDFKELIETSNCGLWNDSGNINEFAENIIKLASNQEMMIEMGENGRLYMEENFDVSTSVKLIENFMKN